MTTDNKDYFEYIGDWKMPNPLSISRHKYAVGRCSFEKPPPDCTSAELKKWHADLHLDLIKIVTHLETPDVSLLKVNKLIERIMYPILLDQVVVNKELGTKETGVIRAEVLKSCINCIEGQFLKTKCPTYQATLDFHDKLFRAYWKYREEADMIIWKNDSVENWNRWWKRNSDGSFSKKNEDQDDADVTM